MLMGELSSSLSEGGLCVSPSTVCWEGTLRNIVSTQAWVDQEYCPELPVPMWKESQEPGLVS
jgi:hypothetical protein